MTKNVEKAVTLQRFLPEVASAVAAGMLRVARATLNLPGVATAVERQEESFFFGQPCRHPHFIGVGGKVHQRPFFEVKQRRTRITVGLVLLNSMTPGLVRAGVFQLNGGHRQAVDRQHHVGAGMVTGVARYLPRYRELVLRIQFQHVGRQCVCRFEIGQPEQLAVKLEAVAQYMQAAFNVQLLTQRVEQHGLQVAAVLCSHVGPQLGLGGLDESEHPCRKQRPRLVPFSIGARLPAAIGEHLFEVSLEGFFRSSTHTGLYLSIICKLVGYCRTEQLSQLVKLFINFGRNRSR